MQIVGGTYCYQNVFVSHLLIFLLKLRRDLQLKIAGHEADCEVAIHAIYTIFED